MWRRGVFSCVCQGDEGSDDRPAPPCGVGLSEESDAVVVIVSEETGAISLATAGRLERNVDLNYLKTRLKELLYAHVATAQIQEVSQG